MKCENCEQEHNGEYQNKRFCSKSCGKSFGTKKRQVGPIFCINCETQIIGSKQPKIRKYCNQICQKEFERNSFIERWKLGKEDGIRGKDAISNFIRNYLFKKYNNKCVECGWNKINKITEKIPLQVEHINGNWRDNREENLKLLCPNCHSLTSTFGSLNKGNGRRTNALGRGSLPRGTALIESNYEPRI